MEPTQNIYGQDWTEAQRLEVFAKVAADKRDYFELLDALTRLDQSLSGLAQENAWENIDPALTEDCYGYWREMRRQLAQVAGMLWEDNNRDLNAETGMTIY